LNCQFQTALSTPGDFDSIKYILIKFEQEDFTGGVEKYLKTHKIAYFY